jgi:hypothetical protein
MSTVPSKRKHLSRITIDDVAFYYSKGCRVMPQLFDFYLEGLTQLESHGKLCFTPGAILERYHLNLKKRSQEKAKKYASQKR